MTALAVLAVDDEAPSLDELVYLLDRCPEVARADRAANAADALRLLDQRHFDLVLLDVRMPELDGMALARVLSRFSHPPRVAFVTAHEEHAVDAFEVGACGYLLKPVTEERLAALLERVARPDQPPPPADPLDVVAVDHAGTTLLVRRQDVLWVETAGDYVRLHTTDGRGHLVRVPMVTLQALWTPHGFARVHRRYLVDLHRIRELSSDGAQTTVVIGDRRLPVSRRHAAEVRRRLVASLGRGGR